MEQTVTIQTLVYIGGIIMGIWGFYKFVMEVIKAITDRHDKEQKWDEMAKKIDENHLDTEQKIKELTADISILTECMSAVLDGLKQLNCNGTVSEMKTNLDKYIQKRAYERR